MADDKIIRCDCGYRLRARTEQRQVAEVRRHAREAHGISFSTEEALAVLLRLELEIDEGVPADLATASDTVTGKEKQ
jgi:predicted small metal-binding protein